MNRPNLKLVEPTNVDNEISEIAAGMDAAKRSLVKGNGKLADVLPPSGEPQRYDDLANSQRFLSLVGDDMLYCPESKKWLTWRGTHWQTDNEDFVFQFAKEFAADLYNSALDKEAMKNAQRACNRAGFNAFIELAMRNQSTPIDAFDNQPYLLNCKNGTLDLKTGKLSAHNKADRITRVVSCEYDADAYDPIWDEFLADVQPDPTIRAFLQRSMGYSLLGCVPEACFFILFGTGNNGKSIFTNLFNKLLGGYASTTPSATLMQRQGERSTNDIARLKGKRLCVVPETEENERINASMIKAMASGDTISARFLFAEFFDFDFTATLWVATNHKPVVTDPSPGFWRRVKLVPFTVSIAPDKVRRSDEMMARLLSVAPAVLNWAVQGARDYFDLDGLDVPPVIQAEIDAYRKEQDSIAQFLEERCEILAVVQAERPGDFFNGLDYRVSNGDLYDAYKTFCTKNGEYLRSHRRLTQNMHERGFRQLNSGGRYWEGIRLLASE